MTKDELNDMATRMRDGEVLLSAINDAEDALRAVKAGCKVELTYELVSDPEIQKALSAFLNRKIDNLKSQFASL